MRSSVELEEKRRLGYVKRREGERAAAAQRDLGPDPARYPSCAVGGDRRIRASHCDVRGRTRRSQKPLQSEFAELLPAPFDRRARGETASAPRALGPQARWAARPSTPSAGVGAARAGAGCGALCAPTVPPLWGAAAGQGSDSAAASSDRASGANPPGDGIPVAPLNVSTLWGDDLRESTAGRPGGQLCAPLGQSGGPLQWGLSPEQADGSQFLHGCAGGAAGPGRSLPDGRGGYHGA